jgi:DNA replication protein DnaC
MSAYWLKNMTDPLPPDKRKSIGELLRSIHLSLTRPVHLEGREALSHEGFLAETERLSREAKLALATEREANRQLAINQLVQRAAIPERFREADLEDPLGWRQGSAYTAAREFVRNFGEVRKRGGGLLIWGEIGSGKTHLACAIANTLMQHMHTVMYCTLYEAVFLFKASWRKDSDVSEYTVLQQFSTPELLILDEIGVQNNSEFERMMAAMVLDARSRDCLPTIGISNLDPKEVTRVLGERAYDRLTGFGGKLIRLFGPSLRGPAEEI